MTRDYFADMALIDLQSRKATKHILSSTRHNIWLTNSASRPPRFGHADIDRNTDTDMDTVTDA
eukprot:3315918-Alexandrium_andersonii.AAC.1